MNLSRYLAATALCLAASIPSISIAQGLAATSFQNTGIQVQSTSPQSDCDSDDGESNRGGQGFCDDATDRIRDLDDGESNRGGPGQGSGDSRG